MQSDTVAQACRIVNAVNPFRAPAICRAGTPAINHSRKFQRWEPRRNGLCVSATTPGGYAGGHGGTAVAAIAGCCFGGNRDYPGRPWLED